jgi:hypothetical protein
MNALQNVNNSPIPEKTIQEVDKPDHDRISISISRKAYDVLVEHTKQLNEGKPDTQKTFSIEEVLDEEIILLFGDGWKLD